MDVPKTEPVEFVRHGKIVGRDMRGPNLVLRLADEVGRLGHKARCVVSEDAAGDRMRGPPLVCSGYYVDSPNAPEVAVFAGQVGTETEGDWLWVEAKAPAPGVETLAELMRRHANPGGASPQWPHLGDLVGGGRRQ